MKSKIQLNKTGNTWFSNSIERMPMSFLRVETVFTVIEIITDFTLEPSTHDGAESAPITHDTGMVARYNLHFSHQTRPVTLFREIDSNIQSICRYTCRNKSKTVSLNFD